MSWLSALYAVNRYALVANAFNLFLMEFSGSGLTDQVRCAPTMCEALRYDLLYVTEACLHCKVHSGQQSN